ncbi:MAG: ATPase, partial [Merismopedia sp. SIO2A8]|nr:ATPase [Merismopedia sp. SIO2A8]
MRQEVVDRLQVLRMEKLGSIWTDGWVYGRLKEEFELQPDELEFFAEQLGFKYGWNPKLQAVLEQQWQQQGPIWKGIQQTVAAQTPSAHATVKSSARSPRPSTQQRHHSSTPKPSTTRTTPKKTPVGHESHSSGTNNLESCLDQLHSLVGLDTVKSTVQELVNITKVAQMQANVGLKAPAITRHL